MWHFADCRNRDCSRCWKMYIRQVALCLDRDRAGLQAEERIQKNLEGRGYREVFPLFPSGKDWNEDLQELMAQGRRENLQMQ